MGSGKTSWCIDHINTHPEENFLYITPFLEEDERIIKSCFPVRDFRKPVNKGKGKLSSLNDLLMCQEDIVSTHELFKHIDEDTKTHIENGHYTLILDEVLEVISPLNIKRDDLKVLRESECISIDEGGIVIWNQDKLDYDTKYNDIKILAENHCLIQVNGTFLVWRYNPEIFALFDKVYILTYLFEASILRYFFDCYGLSYIKKSVIYKEGKYELVDYYVPDATQYAELINVYEGNLNTNFTQKDTGLSASWFKSSQNGKKIRQLKNNVQNYFKNILGVKAESIMWTTFKDCFNKIKGKGYTNSFVSCNCRSTNEYSERSSLAYVVNIYVHPAVKIFFLERGIRVDQDKYALSEMLQWIWRSRIRKGEPINIYIPSRRMRGLLMKWLKNIPVVEV